jgi:glyoxylase-like metal-dependent hydrolase (beta-lactamase superfamily II)
MHPDMRIIPNTGWDNRITLFQYKRIVTNFAVVTERYVVLIDTLVNEATAEFMVSAMHDALAAGRQLLVINTHADWDHYWGNTLFAGASARYPAPLIGHRLCRERVLAGAWSEYLAELQDKEPETYRDVRLQPPTITFEGTFVIDGGDLTLELIHMPGHKPDQIAVFIPEIRTLFPADAAEDPLPFVYNAADVPLLRASFERLLALKPETVLYCHVPGSESHQPDVIHQNIAYFNEIERRAIAALQAGRVPLGLEAINDIEAIVDYPFTDVPHIDRLIDEEERTFYRRGHQNALRTMLEYVRLQQADRV